jgi:DnaK suppressor protein
MPEKNRIQLPDNYLPSESEEYMNQMQVEYFRQKLQNWKDELLHESKLTLDHLKEENWHESDANDRATVESEAALELKTRDRYRKLIEKIDTALAKMDKDEYGYCEETGEEIGLRRLMARPIATLCIEAQERHEKYERQHSEDE